MLVKVNIFHVLVLTFISSLANPLLMFLGQFSGKVLVNISNLKSPSYTLYFQKNSEFNINGGTEKDYVNNGTVNNGGWTSSNGQSVCSCN